MKQNKIAVEVFIVGAVCFCLGVRVGNFQSGYIKTAKKYQTQDDITIKNDSKKSGIREEKEGFATKTEHASAKADKETKADAEGQKKSEKRAVPDKDKGKEVWEELPIVSPSISADEANNVSLRYSKQEHTLYVLNEGDVIAKYSAGSGRVKGDKEKEGDKRTPEGEFYVCVKNEASQYHLAFGLSYPNMEDAKRGLDTGLITQEEYDSIMTANENQDQPDWYTALGGEIMIHGQKGEQGGESHWTSGCIAVNDKVMDEIWDYVNVGTKVTIEP